MMQRLKIGIGLCLALLIILPASATAKIGPMPEMPGHSQGCENGVDWSKPDANNIWQERAIGSRYFGWINYTNGHATGRFVDFYFNESTGAISQYRVKVYSKESIETLDVFESITGNFQPSEVRVMGSIFMAKGTQGIIIVHDNPAAVIHHIIWNSTNVVYNIGTDFYATTTYRNYTFPNVAWLLSNTTNLTGSVIAGNGTMNVESKKIEVSLSSAQASFRLHSLHRYGHPLLALHYASGKVGADISLSLRNGMVLDDIAAYREDIRAQVLEMNEERLRLRIEGEGTGTVIALTLENQVKDANRLRVKMDGAEIKKGSIEEVFGTLNGEAKFALAQDDAGNPVLYIYFPHFSSHELEIFASSEINITYIVVAFVIGLVAGVALAYLVFRAKKSSQ